MTRRVEGIGLVLQPQMVSEQVLLDLTSVRALRLCSFNSQNSVKQLVCPPQVVLHSNSPVSADLLAVMDSEVGGSEHGVDMNEGLALACT